MRDNDTFYTKNWFLILLVVLVKIPLFFTMHIQEDSFITWRVAKNLVDYGVIGFNGEEKISASTTHLYVLVSAFFQLVLGKYFMYPLLLFSSFMFAMGSLFLAKTFFEDRQKIFWFVVLLNLVPPALTASFLGMEYGILFFLYGGLLYYGLYQNRNWAFFVFPFLMLWTRIDTVIFLGVMFLADLILKRKINFRFILGGAIGLGTVVLFNFLYFGNLVNHTITAKKVAYKGLNHHFSIDQYFYQAAYYGGLLRKSGNFSLILFFAFVLFMIFISVKVAKSLRIEFKHKVFYFAVLGFAFLKLTVFIVFKAHFDWYYWLPRAFMFAALFFFFLNFSGKYLKKTLPLMLIFAAGLYSFQWVQSYAIGFMETKQRMGIARDLEKDHTDISKSIILEPAGKIPFYTGLYTYDEVGLVEEQITDEIIKDEKYWWINSVKKFKPDYVVSIIHKPGTENTYYRVRPGEMDYFNTNYKLVKEYPIQEVYDSAPQILKIVYGIRAIGQDYYLYKKVNP